MESLHSRVAIFFFPLEARHAFPHTMTTQHPHGTIRSSPDHERRISSPLLYPHPRSSIPISAPSSPTPVSRPHPHLRSPSPSRGFPPAPIPVASGLPERCRAVGKGISSGVPPLPKPILSPVRLCNQNPPGITEQPAARGTHPVLLHPSYSPPSLPCPCDPDPDLGPSPGPPGRYLPPLPPLPSCRRPALRCPHRGRGH